MEPYPDSSLALWFQPPVTTTRRRRSTPLIDPVFLIILIPVLALLFFFICIPPFLSHASHILNPGSVKSTWDSLNMFLVLFAILCGLMSRKDDDVTLTSSSNVVTSFVAESSDGSVQPSGHWVGFSDKKVMPYGYLDVDTLRESENLNQSRRSEEDEVVFPDVKEIPVDTFVVTSNAPEVLEQQPHSFRSVGKDVKFNVPTNMESDDSNKVMISYPTPPPPPPMKLRPHHKHKTLERKVSDATKEIAKTISSLYNHKKKKSKQHPPLPPPPSVFRNPFKKGGKHNKKIYSVPATAPPPSSIFNNTFKSGNKSKRFLLPATKSKRFNASSPPPLPPPRYTMSTGKPPLPTKSTSSYYESGSQSPLIIPMAPPPPPFKVSDMKFEVRGDFVKIRSTHSCVCSSPDHGEYDDVIGPDSGLICFPSPDVDAKADSFISRLRDEWKKEKINYVNEKLG